jgi:hypothetical protein
VLARVVAFIRGIVRRRTIGAEVDDELRFHIEQENRRDWRDQQDVFTGLAPSGTARSVSGAKATRYRKISAVSASPRISSRRADPRDRHPDGARSAAVGDPEIDSSERVSVDDARRCHRPGGFVGGRRVGGRISVRSPGARAFGLRRRVDDAGIRRAARRLCASPARRPGRSRRCPPQRMTLPTRAPPPVTRAAATPQ